MSEDLEVGEEASNADAIASKYSGGKKLESYKGKQRTEEERKQMFRNEHTGGEDHNNFRNYEEYRAHAKEAEELRSRYMRRQ